MTPTVALEAMFSGKAPGAVRDGGTLDLSAVGLLARSNLRSKECRQDVQSF